MGGVAAEQVVGKTGLGLNLRRQGSEGLAKPLRRMRGQSLSGSSGRVRPARCSCNASSARVSSAPGCFANEASQSPSAFTSSRMAAAKASWSAGGSLDAASKAFFSLLVMVPIYGRSVRRANCTTLPNVSRLSCGRLARLRKVKWTTVRAPRGAQHSASFKAITARQLQALVRRRPDRASAHGASCPAPASYVAVAAAERLHGATPPSRHRSGAGARLPPTVRGRRDSCDSAR